MGEYCIILYSFRSYWYWVWLRVWNNRLHGQGFSNKKLNQDPHVSLAPAPYSSDQRHAYPAPVTKKDSDRTENSSDGIHVIILIYTLSISGDSKKTHQLLKSCHFNIFHFILLKLFNYVLGCASSHW